MAWTKRKGMPKIQRQTQEIDASGQVVGRLATKIAKILIGKNKASYEPHQDTGDIVKVINADKVVFTGRKWEQKMHFRSSNRPSGITRTLVSDLRKENPALILKHAVRYMLPKNRTQKARMQRLKIV